MALFPQGEMNLISECCLVVWQSRTVNTKLQQSRPWRERGMDSARYSARHSARYSARHSAWYSARHGVWHTTQMSMSLNYSFTLELLQLDAIV